MTQMSGTTIVNYMKLILSQFTSPQFTSPQLDLCRFSRRVTRVLSLKQTPRFKRSITSASPLNSMGRRESGMLTPSSVACSISDLTVSTSCCNHVFCCWLFKLLAAWSYVIVKHVLQYITDVNYKDT